ncbi:hypothetical protein AF72_01190 [Xylella taiwanensis]|uniref:Uncharacterized protein n=1 Tax=Xylella taiwanensis TaxID=1444770 RepID=Z9JLE3_9GAMM|nr:hypothetical protein AB672_05130 [Xylella taiwanensis]EWS79230.1 hypothetical protein AF72_01190 [Xylella taiwanensis]
MERFWSMLLEASRRLSPRALFQVHVLIEHPMFAMFACHSYLLCDAYGSGASVLILMCDGCHQCFWMQALFDSTRGCAGDVAEPW